MTEFHGGNICSMSRKCYDHLRRATRHVALLSSASLWQKSTGQEMTRKQYINQSHAWLIDEL